ncbi:hypothetical protein CR513_59416, partial [Mucuna pruriens]
MSRHRSQTILLEEADMPLQTPDHNSLRQQGLVHLSVDQRVSLTIKDKVVDHLSRAHQTNGQAELANRVILRGLRRRLEEEKGRWVEELPQPLSEAMKRSPQDELKSLSEAYDDLMPLSGVVKRTHQDESKSLRNATKRPTKMT